MTVVLVHGNPETDAVWDPLVDALGRHDVIRLSPPDWGTASGRLARNPSGLPRLAGRRVGHLAGPIDLVGHDWGGNHVVNAMMNRPELVRGWASDIIGVFDPDYVGRGSAGLADAGRRRTVGRRHDERDARGPNRTHGRTGHDPGGSRQGGHRPRPRRWVAHCCCSTVRAPPRAGRGGPAVGAGRGATGSAPVGDRGPLRRHGWRSGAGRRRARAPGPRCSTDWATGGWCRTRYAARRR